MTRKQKLELTWIGKENRPKLEPRVLIEDLELSYHARHRIGEADIFDNRLIFGDNLLALKALEQEFAGKEKCIFIDPPTFEKHFRVGGAFNRGSCCNFCNNCLGREDLSGRALQPRCDHLSRKVGDIVYI